MPDYDVLVLNATGNVNTFEDAFCSDLCSRIKASSRLVAARGSAISGCPELQTRQDRVLVIVAHGCETALSSAGVEAGLSVDGWPESVNAMLNSPTVLLQQISKHSECHAIVFCVCSALSAEVLSLSASDPRCVGVFASAVPILDSDVELVAELVNGLHQAISPAGASPDALSSLANSIKRSDGTQLFRAGSLHYA